VNNIAAVAGGDGKVALAVDCIATMDTLTTVAGCISPLGTLAILLPIKISNTLTVQHADQMLWDFPKGEDPLPKSTKVVRVRTFLYQEQVCQFFGVLFCSYSLLGVLEREFDAEDPSFPAGIWDHQTKSRALDG